MSHISNGNCNGCDVLFDRYPNFSSDLRTWFKALQAKFPEAHISCAGRGAIDQETLFQRGATKAHWGHSAHNYNQAIDIFQQVGAQAKWDRQWFESTVGELLLPIMTWYGKEGSAFYELPHVEMSDWRSQSANNLVENTPISS